ADDHVTVAVALIEGTEPSGGLPSPAEMARLREELRACYSASPVRAEAAAVAVYPELVVLTAPPEQHDVWVVEEHIRRSRRAAAAEAAVALLCDVRGRQAAVRVLAARLAVE